VSELGRLTLDECRTLIAARQLSPVELTAALLGEIERLDPELHAFITVTGDQALSEAAAAERELMRGVEAAPLHGVPFAVKDVICTAGVATTGQSRSRASFVPDRDAAAVAAVRRAGGILLGKLTTHELAIGGPDFEAPWPPARNPWDPRRFAGGSSSGSAVAVAAGMVPVALGTDTGGSIRNPSTLCGAVGLKPTYGAVSRQGMFPLAPTLDHLGPVTRTVVDSELALAVLGRRPVAADAGVAGLRIGHARQFYDGDKLADPDVVEAIDAAVAVLGELGARVEEVELDPLDRFEQCGLLILSVESHTLYGHAVATTPELFGPRARARLGEGSAVPARDYQEALAERRRLKSRLEPVLERFDLLATAATLEPAPRLDDPAAIDGHYQRNATMPFNVTGLPALVVPVGLSRDGLPMSMQLVGRRFDEETVFRAGRAYERARPPLDAPVAARARTPAAGP
jgi:aspartyl-tRNA(Asn)/glutamyl-tRNA(Gln) amidotransferase subunit A